MLSDDPCLSSSAAGPSRRAHDGRYRIISTVASSVQRASGAAVRELPGARLRSPLGIAEPVRAPHRGAVDVILVSDRNLLPMFALVEFTEGHADLTIGTLQLYRRRLDWTMARIEPGSRQRLGKWELLDVIGKGGNGQVWRARTDTGQQGAIKVLHQGDRQASQPALPFRGAGDARPAPISEGVLPLLDAHLPDAPKKKRTAPGLCRLWPCPWTRRSRERQGLENAGGSACL